MSSQHNTDAKNGMADFSSALMNAAASKYNQVETSSIKQTSTAVAQYYQEYDPFNNRNLSSEITRIRDEGPATSQLTDDVYKHASNQAEVAASAGGKSEKAKSCSSAMRSSENDYRISSEKFVLDDTDRGQYAGKKRNSIGQQLVLMLLVSVIAVMGFLLYQLKMQTDEVGEALRLSEEQPLLNSVSEKQSPEFAPMLKSLSEEIGELREQLKLIKTDYQASDDRLALNIPRELKPQLMKIAAASEDVNALQSEFNQIQGRVHEIGAEVRVIKNEVLPDKVQVSPSSWVVNLAALSSQDKAQVALEKLRQSAASPVVQEVVVNGKKMYRISAEGFSTPEEAVAFITEAKEQYGFDGGWIKQI
jgi:cell division septation protein DedD